MSEYYLMSQLPSLDGIGENGILPITEERFSELCHRFLGKKAQGMLDKLTLAPAKDGESCSSALISAWNEGERALRLALGKVRAEKMKKTFDTGHTYLSAELMKAAQTAVEMESPLEAEQFLSLHRLKFLETLRPMDGFSEDAVYYYGLKLKLILRIRSFDTSRGEAAYRNIYTSILNGEQSEAMQ